MIEISPHRQSSKSRPAKCAPIHLWIYNHPFYGISDQIDYFVDGCCNAGYHTTVGKQPRSDALNVVIENFSAETKAELIDFCRKNRKRVGVIMTEHVDFMDGVINIHGDPLWTENDYMHPVTQINRLRHLFDCLPFTRCYLTLGDLPQLVNLDAMLPGVAVVRMPFPRIAPRYGEVSTEECEFKQDLLFTGFVTAYRRQIIDTIEGAGLSVYTPSRFVSRNRRNALNRSSRIALNIPQRDGWRWLSLMRIYAALKCGRATISLNTTDSSEISRCCVQLPTVSDDWTRTLAGHVSHWKELYETSLRDYNDMAADYQCRHPFPHDLFELWAITDGLVAQNA